MFLQDRPDLSIADVERAFQSIAYITDQSSNWVFCELSGTGVLSALERICPLDLSDAAFPVGAYARTVMEHMGAAILRLSDEVYLLISAGSSAKSFAHALEQSVRFTQPS